MAVGETDPAEIWTFSDMPSLAAALGVYIRKAAEVSCGKVPQSFTMHKENTATNRLSSPDSPTCPTKNLSWPNLSRAVLF